MGQDESLPALPDSETTIGHSGAGLSSLPVFIPADHPLESIDVCGNRLTKFPQTLPRLRFLDVSSNSLGDFDFSKLTFSFASLEILRLSRNGFRTLPSVLMTFQNLTNIALDYNQLAGEEVDFSVFPHLAHLDLFLNLFNEFPRLPKSLVSLNIGFNNIHSLSLDLANVTELRLAGNDITEFPRGCALPKLKILDLAMNRLVELPPIAQFAPQLSVLTCPHNFLTCLPPELPLSLQTFDLSHNILCDLGHELGGLTDLQTLDISANCLRALPRLPDSLLHFNASSNEISDAAPMSVTLLNTLQLSSNHFRTIPEFNCSRAIVLLMQSNRLVELRPERISRATKRIDLTKNEISEIPPGLCELTALQFLNLSANRLRSIPPAIATTRLTSLFLSENAISELPELPSTLISLSCVKCAFVTLPETLFRVRRLGYIDFSCNSIETVSSLPNCTTILLSLNRIRQLPALPETLARLDVSCNQLTELAFTGDFISIQDLDASHNQITKFTADSLPVLAICKLTGNPLRLTINFANLPAIRILDIACTQCKIVSSLPSHLKELSVSDLAFAAKLDSPVVRLACFGPGTGYAETIGTRPSMEDALILYHDIMSGLGMYAVIDGHGGNETAILSAYLIPKFFPELTTKSIGDVSLIFRRVNAELQQRGVRDGAAIVITLVGRSEIGCAHLGDSRALIVKRDLTCRSLTVDHKATERSEIDLVKENRSFVDGNRTAGMLAVSRALGDFNVPGVGRVPAITKYPRQRDDFRLVLGCDGVFDVISNDEIGGIIGEEENMQRAAYLLRNVASARGSQDNISVIVVDLTKENP
jgi:Leucine-rich repeat (LRR) protein/serine/threonine protein phosphatase PrpC